MNEHATGAAIELSPLELAAGTVIGEMESAPMAAAGGHPRDALAAACLRALRRAPCAVSFSGGRDSSAILAVAADTARRHGLSPPVPVSLRFPRASTTAESEWQELVIEHLGLPDWERVELGDELDFLGEIACAGLRRHGLLWPANAHFHDPILALASGGSVLTGLDGDGLLGWRWGRLRAALRGPPAPGPRALAQGALTLMPARVRARRYGRRTAGGISWLRDDAERALRARQALGMGEEPIRWDRRVAWFGRRRYHHVGVHSLGLLAADHDTQLMHPLLDPAFLASVAADGGRAGYGTRGAAMRALFGDLLPDALLQRPRKAEFGRAFWGPRARAFTAAWDGHGLDRALVDGDALRASWAGENPPLAAATVMQAAWLGAIA